MVRYQNHNVSFIGFIKIEMGEIIDLTARKSLAKMVRYQNTNVSFVMISKWLK